MKSALITGAASGIGKACAQRMAKEGYGVVVADVNMAAAKALVQELTKEGLYDRSKKDADDFRRRKQSPYFDGVKDWTMPK